MRALLTSMVKFLTKPHATPPESIGSSQEMQMQAQTLWQICMERREECLRRLRQAREDNYGHDQSINQLYQGWYAAYQQWYKFTSKNRSFLSRRHLIEKSSQWWNDEVVKLSDAIRALERKNLANSEAGRIPSAKEMMDVHMRWEDQFLRLVDAEQQCGNDPEQWHITPDDTPRLFKIAA